VVSEKYPHRGELVSSGDVYPGETTELLVISCDDWNRRRVDDLLGLELVPGSDRGPYSPVIEVAGQSRTIYGDTIIRLSKAGLVPTGSRLDDRALAEVDAVLERALFTTERPARTAGRPPRFPLAGQVRFANLHIEGQGEKPVVIVSTEVFAAESDYRFVIACRQTSNPNNPREFDVVLGSGGKVICSSLQTVDARDLRERSPQGAAVTRVEREAIIEAVRRMVGLG
jgi:hypothetical protein